MKNITLNDIAGYTKEKEELVKIIDILNNASSYQTKGGYIPKGLILYGDPGNGKTLFSKVLAAETNFNFIDVDITDGKLAANLRKAYKLASRKGNCIIFVDEINRAIAKCIYDETDTTRQNITTLLSIIDGYKTKNNNTIFFVATANDFEDLPEALVRPGRIDKKLNICAPSKESRKEILNYYISKTNCKFTIDENHMVELTKNMSSAGIKTLVNECVLSSNKDNIVTEAMFMRKITEIISENLVEKTTKRDDYIITYQEVGKYVVASNYFSGDCILNINNNGSSSGELFDKVGVASSNSNDDDDDYYDDDDDDELSKTKSSSSKFLSENEFIYSIRIMLGGIIANSLFNNGPYSIDNSSISSIRSMINYALECGFYGIEHSYSCGEYDTVSQERIIKRENKIEEILLEQYKITEDLVKQGHDTFKLLVPTLLKERVLDSKKIRNLLSK